MSEMTLEDARRRLESKIGNVGTADTHVGIPLCDARVILAALKPERKTPGRVCFEAMVDGADYASWERLGDKAKAAYESVADAVLKECAVQPEELKAEFARSALSPIAQDVALAVFRRIQERKGQ